MYITVARILNTNDVRFRGIPRFLCLLFSSIYSTISYFVDALYCVGTTLKF